MAKEIPSSPKSGDLYLHKTSEKPEIDVEERFQDYRTDCVCTFREFEPPGEDEPPNHFRATYELRDSGGDGRVVHAYNLRQRVKTYGPGHLVLSGFGAQQLDRYRVAGGILFMQELEEDCSGFFNGCGYSHGGIHFQYVLEELPIWRRDHSDGRLRISGGDGSVSRVDWFFDGLCFSSDNAAVLTDSVWIYVKDDPGMYDLLFNRKDTQIRCIPVRRRARRATSLCITDYGHYGDFGGMELSGVIMTQKESPMALAFREAEKNSLDARLKMAFKEVCW